MEKVTFHDLVVKLKELARELERTPTQLEFLNAGVSKRQIAKYKYSKIVEAAGLEQNKHSQTTDPIQPVIRPPKILFFDIETAPITSYVWGLFDQNIGLNQVIEDWFVLSFAARYQGETEYHYFDQRSVMPVQNDEDLLKSIHEVLSGADVLIGHNSVKFDFRKLNARFIKYGLQPLNHFIHIDTLKIARKHFSFTSNKLSYLAEYLKCEIKKSEHKEFDGMSLWTECLKNNQRAFEVMEQYNKTDVDVLEIVYNKLAPWEPSINFQAFYFGTICSCGHTKFFKDGFRYTRQGKFQVFRCHNCSKTFTAKENLIDKDLRKTFFK
jgi:DNA polymerase elongation subunit (family B)